MKSGFAFKWLWFAQPLYLPTGIPTKYFCGLVRFPNVPLHSMAPAYPHLSVATWGGPVHPLDAIPLCGGSSR